MICGLSCSVSSEVSFFTGADPVMTSDYESQPFDDNGLDPEGEGYEFANSDETGRYGNRPERPGEPGQKAHGNGNGASRSESPGGSDPEWEQVFGQLETDEDYIDAAFIEPEERPQSRRPAASLPDQVAGEAHERASLATTSHFLEHQARRLDFSNPDAYTHRPGAGDESNFLAEALMGRFDPQACSAGLVEDLVLIQALAEAASRARSSGEAAGLGAAMVPPALRSVPAESRGLWPLIPALILGVQGAILMLRRQPGAGPWIARAVPAALLQAVAHLARSLRHGQAVSVQVAAAVLAGEIERALSQSRLVSPGTNPYSSLRAHSNSKHRKNS
jgi:hypothetical protein